MDREDLYEKFHEHVEIVRVIPNRRDFTYRIILRRLQPLIKPGGTALDIGCGNGVLSLYLGQQGMEVLGTDISKSAVESARASAEFHHLNSKVKFSTDDFAKGQVRGSFDLVLFTEVVEHLPNDRESLKRIFELTKPGGHLFLSTPSERALTHRLKIMFFGKDMFDIEVGHLRRYNVGSISNLVTEAGFNIEKIDRTEGPLRNFIFVTKFGNNLMRFLRWRAKDIFGFFDWISLQLFGESQIIVIAKKE